MLNPVTPHLYTRELLNLYVVPLNDNKRVKNSFKYHKNFKKTNRCKDIVHMFSFVIRCEREKNTVQRSLSSISYSWVFCFIILSEVSIFP